MAAQAPNADLNKIISTGIVLGAPSRDSNSDNSDTDELDRITRMMIRVVLNPVSMARRIESRFDGASVVPSSPFVDPAAPPRSRLQRSFQGKCLLNLKQCPQSRRGAHLRAARCRQRVLGEKRSSGAKARDSGKRHQGRKENITPLEKVRHPGIRVSVRRGGEGSLRPLPLTPRKKRSRHTPQMRATEKASIICTYTFGHPDPLNFRF